MAFLPYIIEAIKDTQMSGAGMNNKTRSGKDKNAHKILVGKPEGTRPLGRFLC
jgi:hypothetical protein